MVRWGILSTGKIANKFAEDFKYSQGGVIHAIASRSKDKARAFAHRFHIKKAYTSYEELVEDSEIQVVYIGTPHNLHFEHIKMCLLHKKAVLCEKPITVNRFQLNELIELAQKQNVFLMEALWTYFLPTIRKATQWVADGRIGEVKVVQANFGFQAEFNPHNRLYNPELAGGSLLDIGIYPVALANLFINSTIHSISTQSVKAPTGVDEQTAILIRYKNGAIANLLSSFAVTLNNTGFIYGTKGYIELPKFWMASKAFLFENNILTETFETSGNSIGMNYEVDEVNRLITEGKTQSEIMPYSTSLKIISFLDEIRSMIKLSYPFE